jgi:hypothetical protein
VSYYRQSEACPKFGVAQGHGASSGAAYGRDHYALSYQVYAPEGLQPDMGSATRWTPYGTFVSKPYEGGWDGLEGRLMHVPQADLYNTSQNPWPANGVDDQPNAAMNILRLAPTTSAHPGYSLPSLQPNATMIFQPPPIFGLQSIPIPAFGV